MRLVKKIFLWWCIVMLGIVVAWNAIVLRQWLPYIRASQESYEMTYPVGIVLWASVKRDGTLSASLQERVDAAIDAIKTWLVKQLLISGDGVEDEIYKETPAMYKAVVDAGVPERVIIVDPAGVDTYDSMRRAKEFYKLDRVVIFSQWYHLARSVYIARGLGIDARGWAVDGHDHADVSYFSMREILARVKAAVEIELIHPWAKYGTRLVSH